MKVFANREILNIINSISMSVSARMKQYGILRAIGMDDAQLKRMISAEAGTYAVSGLVVGIALGLVLNRKLYIENLPLIHLAHKSEILLESCQ